MKITIDEIMQLSRIFSVRISSDKVVENFLFPTPIWPFVGKCYCR